MCTASKSGFRHGERPLAVDWQDCGWCPLIAVQSWWGERLSRRETGAR